jgi:hypothetical protein
MIRFVQDTLLTFGKDARHGLSGKIGSILTLSAWGQQLELEFLKLLSVYKRLQTKLNG